VRQINDIANELSENETQKITTQGLHIIRYAW
jgi:hypothetical protein